MRRRFVLLLAFAAVVGARGDGAAQARAGVVNAEDGLGIGGFDPVAYFTETRAVAGRAEVSAVHAGVTYRFASEANRAAFLADPAKFLPQYGGYCAYGMARGYKAVIDPAAFTVAGGKLYLNYNRSIAGLWQGNRAREIQRADAHWPTVMHSPDVAR
jgi:YHS domain-containing protein